MILLGMRHPRQAAHAEAEGYSQLARNFRRAAELTAIPTDVLLATYNKLCPYRSTYYALLAPSRENSAPVSPNI